MALSASGGAPPELALGPCIEVWSDFPASDGMKAAVRAMSNYHRARRAWGDGLRATGHEPPDLNAPSSPWSLHYCDATYGPDRAGRRLDAAGVTRDDLPRLQEAAQAWPTNRHTHRNSQGGGRT